MRINTIPYLFIILSILLSIGCQGLEIKRTVQDDNIFSSSSQPRIRIKINDDFKYVEHSADSRLMVDFFARERSSDIKVDDFLFKDKNNDNTLLLIRISTVSSPRWYFLPSLYKIENTIDSGSVDILGDKYQYAVYPSKQESGTMLVKVIGRRVGGSGNVKFEIFYIEKVRGNWDNTSNLSERKKARLNNFSICFDKAFQIVEYQK